MLTFADLTSAPVVQEVDGTIHRINHSPVDSAILLVSPILIHQTVVYLKNSAIQRLNNQGLEIISHRLPSDLGESPYKSARDGCCLAQGSKLQILVSFRVFGMERHFIQPFWYRLGLCLKKFTKNCVVSVFIWSPLGVSLSLSGATPTLVSLRDLI